MIVCDGLLTRRRPQYLALGAGRSRTPKSVLLAVYQVL